MKLISCDTCAVMLDYDKLYFPRDCYTEEGDIDPNKAEYNQTRKTYEAYVLCPLCKNKIFKEN